MQMHLFWIGLPPLPFIFLSSLLLFHLSIHLPPSLCLSLPSSLFLCLSISLSLSIYLPPSLCFYISLPPSVYLSPSLSPCLCLSPDILSVYLSFPVSVSLCLARSVYLTFLKLQQSGWEEGIKLPYFPPPPPSRITCYKDVSAIPLVKMTDWHADK